MIRIVMQIVCMSACTVFTATGGTLTTGKVSVYQVNY